MNGNIKYYMNEKSEYVIEDYNNAKAFSSFLPSVAGKFGKPIWAYYVNRGQGLSSIGVNNKTHQMMEFFPANAAYRETPLQGFRTFVKVKSKEGVLCYEPFQNCAYTEKYNPKQSIYITPHDFRIEEVNSELGLKFIVQYCTLPNENISSVVRKITIVNLTENSIDLEVIDGLPVVVPYCIEDVNFKGTGNNLQAYMRVYDHKKHPYFKLDMVPTDDPEVKIVEEGFFYVDVMTNSKNELEMSKYIVDPELVFGNATDLRYPVNFYSAEFKFPENQDHYGKLPCGFAYKNISLDAKKCSTSYSFVGQSNSREKVSKFVDSKLSFEYIENKIKENYELIQEIMSPIETLSSSPELDMYFSQSFLDNVLRGGTPVQLGNEKHNVYLYSRLHGDLEKDYNFFELENTYYSQGNGHYRDVNQNRRNDTLFYPFVADSNIWAFFTYLKLDGFNPLKLKGNGFYITKENSEALYNRLKNYMIDEQSDKVVEFTRNYFTPGKLLEYTETVGVVFKNNEQKEQYVNDVFELCEKDDIADCGHGYYIDHWTYNLDLLKQFEAIYPEKILDIIFNKKDYYYWDEELFVQPRDKKYILTKDGVRQIGSFIKSETKIKQIKSRDILKNAVRANNGDGDIYYCSLISKIICLLTNKISSLDPFGIGVEMEANNPGWCDTLTMMAGYLGSAVNETIEIISLAEYTLTMLTEQNKLENINIEMPVEIYEFYNCINELLQSNCTDFEYWDDATSAREKFRKNTFMGIVGEEKTISSIECEKYVKNILNKLEKVKVESFCKDKEVYNTYFINDVVRYKEIKDEHGDVCVNDDGLPYVKALEFKQTPLPLFLEGNARMLKLIKDKKEASKLHEKVKATGLYDIELGMYKINEPVPSEFRVLGKHSLYPPGTRENESIFVHVEYKYLLSLLLSNLNEEFYEEMKTAFIPFIDPEKYGRSILENSSFLISSAYHNKNEHGRGLRPRSTGTSAEVLSIWKLMVLGKNPFVMDETGQLNLRFKPILPGWLFTNKDSDFTVYSKGEKRTISVEKNSFAFCFLGTTPIIYHNPTRKDLFNWDDIKIENINIIVDNKTINVNDDVIVGELAEKVRLGQAQRIDVYIS